MRARLGALAVLLALLVCFNAAQDAPKRIRIGAEALEAKLVQRVEPQYPPMAAQIKLQGTVRLEIVVGEDGSVKEARSLMGHPMFVPLAIEAAKQWKYEPILLNGAPVEVISTIDMPFKEGMGQKVVSETPEIAEARLRKNPDDPEAHLQLAIARRGRGELDAAIASFRRALDLDPSLNRAQFELIQTLMSAKHDPEAAAAELRRWTQRNPTDGEARMRLARVLMDIDDLDGAISEIMETSHTQEYQTDACQQLTGAFLIKYGPDRAAPEMRRLAPHCAEPAALHAAMGDALMQQMRFSSALRQWEESLRLKPDDENLRRRVTQIKSVAAAMECLQQKLSARASTGDMPAALTLAGMRFATTDDKEAALAAIREVFKKTSDPEVLQSIGSLGPVLTRIGGTGFAIREMEKLRQLRSDVESIQIVTAHLFLTRGRLDEAAGAAQQALSINPRNAEAHSIRAAVYTAKGQVEDARTEQQAAEKTRLDNEQNPPPARINPFQGLESELAGCQPTAMGDARMQANETSAVGALRSLNTAAVHYRATFGGGYPLSLAAMGPGNPPSAQAANLIDAVLAGGTRSGYVFIYTAGQTDPTGNVVTYAITAEPVQPGTTGSRWFYTDQSGVIRQNPTGRAGPADPPIS